MGILQVLKSEFRKFRILKSLNFNNFHIFQYMVKCGKKDSPEEGTKAEVSGNFINRGGVLL